MKTVAVACLALLVAGVAAQGTPHGKVRFMDMKKGLGSHAGPQTRVIDGKPAQKGQFPYQAGLYLDYAAFCGGSLINPRWILTAAHCVDGISVWTVFLGVTDMQLPYQSEREVFVTRGGIRHPDYDSRRIVNDVAVIELQRDAPLSEFVKPIALVKSSVSSLVGKSATASGFGKVRDASLTISETLQFTQMQIVEDTVCSKTYGSIHESVLCVKGLNNTSICNGDSGGPLVLKDDSGKLVEVGVVSFGHISGCQLGFPTGFAKVSKFIPWISQTTGLQFD